MTPESELSAPEQTQPVPTGPTEAELDKIFAQHHERAVAEMQAAARADGELAVTGPRDLAAVLDMARARSAGRKPALTVHWCSRCRTEHDPADSRTCDAALSERLDTELAEMVPPRYRQAELDDEAVAAWLAGTFSGLGKESLILVGQTGTGKTHQMFGVLKAVAREGRIVRVVNVTTLLDRLRPDGGDDLDGYIAVPWLFLDDLTGHKPTAWTEEILYRLINARYEAMAHTVLTTNTASAELKDVLGDRIASRLAEMATVIPITGPDRRRVR